MSRCGKTHKDQTDRIVNCLDVFCEYGHFIKILCHHRFEYQIKVKASAVKKASGSFNLSLIVKYGVLF
ncbi:MAG: hypothetical protein AB8B77_08060 [Alphaproteobacteria bacterium]